MTGLRLYAMRLVQPPFDETRAARTMVIGRARTTSPFKQYAVVGELTLDGSTRPIKGVLSMAVASNRYVQKSVTGLPPRIRG